MGLICILQPGAPSTLGRGAAAIWVLCQLRVKSSFGLDWEQLLLLLLHL